MILLAVLFAMLTVPAFGQRPQYGKMSPMLRHLAKENHNRRNALRQAPERTPVVCAFVKIANGQQPTANDGEEALARWGCKVLTRIGDICIASIPITSIAPLSLEPSIVRMEARPSLPKGRDNGNALLTDSMAMHINALPVYEGTGLPQAFTGKGVVVGLMDIGFDLTHPTFFSSDGNDYRIQRLWDMLSADTVGSPFYVGRDYVGRDELLALQHCRDGEDQYHGTHTAAIAAGSGAGTRFKGMAPEADICLVANAVSSDIVYIDSADYEKYTFATDALGFKYIADYAKEHQQPCVISFSEGSTQDFWGYDLLYYEMLSQLTGPGCIIVSAAGNSGNDPSWFRKELGEPFMGTFIRQASGGNAILTLKSPQPFTIRIVNYLDESDDTLIVNTTDVLQLQDSLRTDTIVYDLGKVQVDIEAYPSCYNADEMCYDVYFNRIEGSNFPWLSLEVLGEEAEVEAYRVKGYWITHRINKKLIAGEKTHSVLSPSTSPDIICVGNNGYSKGRLNIEGTWRGYDCEGNGWVHNSSSVGPTYDGRIKPDVVAPGMNIASAFNSFFEEKYPNHNLCSWVVHRLEHQGRPYSWCMESGTSMSCPAVAGAIALWMQAKPDLTMEDVLDVFQHTCRHVDETLDYPNNYYGYGEIDVYAGLLYLLGVSDINGISPNHTKASIGVSDGQLTIDFGASVDAPVIVRVFSLAGQMLRSEQMPKGTERRTVALPKNNRHPDGTVYVVQIDGPASISGSTLIRL
jgi:subtilisin family serine protease